MASSHPASLFSALLLALLPSSQAATQYCGVSLASAEFGKTPGVYDKDYTYPNQKEVDYFMSKGMQTFRLPFLWERVQPALNGELDAGELKHISEFVSATTAKGAHVVLDLHNYARYQQKAVGSEAVPNAALADVWKLLATTFKDNPRVIFGLMNEPNGMPTEQWRDAANAGIAGIRSAGAKNLILVCGNGFSGGHSWEGNWYGTPNATVMLGIVDPGKNFAFEIHQYLDADSSGSKPGAVSATVGSEKLAGVTRWLKEHKCRGFLGEFGGSGDVISVAALDDMLKLLDSNSDVWLGWTYWAAGPWWGKDYFASIEPLDGKDRPQMESLLRHVPGR
jgi:endoglucanase